MAAVAAALSGAPLPSVDTTCLGAVTQAGVKAGPGGFESIVAELRTFDWEADVAESHVRLDWLLDISSMKHTREAAIGTGVMRAVVRPLSVEACAQRTMELFVHVATIDPNFQLMSELEPEVAVVCAQLFKYCDPSSASPPMLTHMALQLLWKLACCKPLRKQVGRLVLEQGGLLQAVAESDAILAMSKQYVGRLIWALSEVPAMVPMLLSWSESMLLPLLRSHDTETEFAVINAIAELSRQSSGVRERLLTEPEILAEVIALTRRCAGCASAAARTLQSLAQHTEAHSLLLDAGAVTAVSQLLCSTISSSVIGAAGCCGSLCSTVEGAAAVLEAGGVECLLACVAEPLAAGASGAAADALQEVCKHDAIKLRVLESGALHRMRVAREQGRQHAARLIEMLSADTKTEADKK